MFQNSFGTELALRVGDGQGAGSRKMGRNHDFLKGAELTEVPSGAYVLAKPWELDALRETHLKRRRTR